MRMMKNFSVLLLLAFAGVSAAAADAPPAITAHRQAARPGDGPATQDGGDAMKEVLPVDGTGLPNHTASVKAAERPEKGSARYLMVLWEAGTPIPGDVAKKIMKRVAEPDIPKLGGKVLFSRGSQRVIELPLKVVKKLRKHGAVVSLQRLWSGESRSEWAEPADTDTAAQSEPQTSNSRLAVKTDDDTNLDWGPLTYGYDGSGNIKQTSTTANTDSYVYDSAGRLIQATVKGQTETYAYDAFGNMTAKGITGGTSTTIPVDGSSNRLIGPSYDAAGNVLSRDGLEAYEYDSFNMLSKYRRPLAAASYTLEMVYDPDDERLGVLLPGDGSRWSVRDLGGQVIREYDGIRDGNNLFLMWQADYIRGEGGQLLAGETPVWQYNDQNGNGTITAVYGGLRHYHLDHLGSVRLVTDAVKHTLGEHDYYPYGVTPTKAYQEEFNPGTPHIDPMRYAGHQRDFLGYLNVENTDYLDYMHARYYDPKLGRFLSVDPENSASPAKPQSWNRYAYAASNPVGNVDPDGRATKAAEAVASGLESAGSYLRSAGASANGGGALGVAADATLATIGDIVGGTGDMFRVGDAVGGAIGSGATGDELTLAVAKDVGRASALVLTLAVPGQAMNTRLTTTTIVHFTDDAGRAAIQTSGNLRAGTYVTTPSEVQGLTAAQVESKLQITPGKGQNSFTMRVPNSKLAIPPNGATEPVTGAWQRVLTQACSIRNALISP